MSTQFWLSSPRTHSRATPAQIAGAVSAYATGERVSRIRTAHGVCASALYRALDLGGIPRRTTGKTARPSARCEHCGDQFTQWPTGPGRFCSNACRAAHAHAIRLAAGEVPLCKQCGHEVGEGAVYCSPRCRAEAKRVEDEESASAIARLRPGVSAAEAARTLGLGREYVRRLLKDHCPRCSAQLKKGAGRKACPKCDWTNT